VVVDEDVSLVAVPCVVPLVVIEKLVCPVTVNVVVLLMVPVPVVVVDEDVSPVAVPSVMLLVVVEKLVCPVTGNVVVLL
jgi:hypothetical protein